MNRIPQSNNPAMLSKKEAAYLLGISTRTLSRMLHDHQLRVRLGAKRPHKDWRFIRERVETFCMSSSY